MVRPNNFHRALAPVLALSIGVMVFDVIVLPPGLMRLLDLRPGEHWKRHGLQVSAESRRASQRNFPRATLGLSSLYECRAYCKAEWLDYCKTEHHHQLPAPLALHNDEWRQLKPRDSPIVFE